MLHHNFRRMLRRLPLFLCIFLLSSCAAQKKSVSRYQDRDSSPLYSKQGQAETSKSLPVLKNAEPGKYGAGQEKTGNADKTAMGPGEILPALTLVDDRIIAYENKLQALVDFSAEALRVPLDVEQQEKIAACQRQIQNILADYNALHENFLKESSGRLVEISLTDQLVSVERKDIGFLESDCQQIIQTNQQSGAWITGTKYRLIEEKEKEIAQAMARKDYLPVIDIYEQLPMENRQDLSIETTYDYGKALLHTGSAKKAELVFLDLLERIRRESQVKREFHLMKLIADINFGMEEYNKAFERYVDIINRYAGLGGNVEWARKQQSVIGSRGRKGTEVRSYAELMLAYLTYNAERDGYNVIMLARNFMGSYPDSVQYPVAERILRESGDRAEAWFAGIVHHINSLMVEKKHEEGLMLIEQLSRLNLLPEKREQLRLLTDELVSAQSEEVETRRQAREKELQEIWNQGQAHLRAKEYDKAIEVFTLLAQDTAYGDRALMQMKEAVQLAAQENRKTAGDLFVQAKRTKDLEKKTELLLASRELLLSILVKYPQSDLVEKAKKNLSQIEEELMAIDPALLPAMTNKYPSGSLQPESVMPPAQDFSTMRENGQVDSSMYTGKELQE